MEARTVLVFHQLYTKKERGYVCSPNFTLFVFSVILIFRGCRIKTGDFYHITNIMLNWDFNYFAASIPGA